MATLYELTGVLRQLQQMIEDGVEGVEDTLESVQLGAAEKLEGYAMVIKNIQSDIDGLKAEEKRLADRRKAMENSISRMKESMADALLAVEGNRLKTDKFTFSFRKSTKVEIDNIDMIPEDYVRKVYDVNKTDLKKYMERGAIVNGARLVENQSLSIR